ncbi:hypothetical protein MD484_g3129, partial [Candolleomyces efflorescens]
MSEKIQTGRTFIIQNIRSGTVLDLSRVDNRSIVGALSNNNSVNQKWTVNWMGGGWTLRSSTGVYLSLAGVPANGAQIVASATPFIWHIWHDEIFPGVYRIFAPNTTFNFDLSNYGDLASGTNVTLWGKWNGAHQLWDFVQTN